MAKKDIIVGVRSDVQNFKQGASEVREALRAIIQGSDQSAVKFIGNVGKAVSGLDQAMGVVTSKFQMIATLTKGAFDLMKHAGEEQRLAQIVSPETLAILKSSTGGLIEDTVLLQGAAKALRGDLALTEVELLAVSRAALALHEKGLGPAAEIFTRITDALSRGATGSLTEYGIVIEDTHGKQDALNVALQKLNVIALEAGTAQNNLADQTQRRLTVLANAWDDVKTAVGSALGAFLENSDAQLTQFAHVVFGAESAAEQEQKRLEILKLQNAVLGLQQERYELLARVDAAIADSIHQRESSFRTIIATGTKTQVEAALKFGDLDSQMAAAAKARLADLDRVHKAFAETRKKEREESLRGEAILIELRNREVQTLAPIIEQARFEVTLQKEREASMIAQAAAFRALVDAQEQHTAQQLPAMIKQQTEWDRLLEKLTNYQGAVNELGESTFRNFAQAGGEAFGMLITGQEGAGAVLKKFFQQTLLGLAVEMQARAIMALGGYVASFFTAAPLLQAFGIYQAGAIAFGAGAAFAGAGGGGGGGRSSSVPSGGRPTEGRDTIRSGGGGGAGDTIVVHNNIGFGFVGDERALDRTLTRRTREAVLVGQPSGRSSPQRL